MAIIVFEICVDMKILGMFIKFLDLYNIVAWLFRLKIIRLQNNSKTIQSNRLLLQNHQRLHFRLCKGPILANFITLKLSFCESTCNGIVYILK